MERCRDRGRDYIEGDNISIVWFFFNKGLEHESGFFIATPCIFDFYSVGWQKLLCIQPIHSSSPAIYVPFSVRGDEYLNEDDFDGLDV